MRNVKTREGMEYWDKICSLKHYGFLHSPDGKRVVKTEGIGNWIDKFEAQEIVDQAQDEINQYRAERDALQVKLTAADERNDTATSLIQRIVANFDTEIECHEDVEPNDLEHDQVLSEMREFLSGNKTAAQTKDEPASFQVRVKPWMLECFGEVIAADRQERNHRFLEEALELVQATGCNAAEAHQLVEYVYGRPVGDPVQEVGGVMVTLAALCLARGMNMHAAGETELARIWTKVEQIRAKQAAKPAMSPLPGAYPDREQPAPASVVPELTTELRWILGQMCFQHIHTAQALRLMGHEIARKAEDEQAVTIYWMLGHYLKDPANWRRNASAELKASAPSA